MRRLPMRNRATIRITLSPLKRSIQLERLVGIIDPQLSGVLMFTVGLSLLSVMLPLIGMMNSIA